MQCIQEEICHTYITNTGLKDYYSYYRMLLAAGLSLSLAPWIIWSAILTL